MRKIAQSAAEDFSAQIAKKKLRLSKYFRGELGAVKLDSELIRIVLENLLSNAVKYSKKGGRIVFSISRSSSRLLIRVADQGWGIPQAQQAKIFDKLFRADNVRDKEVDGCGLGLYIVRAIVQASGGRISFKSEESKGTVFNVIFPKAGMRFRHGIKSLISGQAV